MENSQYIDAVVFVKDVPAGKLTWDIISMIEGEDSETLHKMKEALIKVLMGM